MNKNFISEAVQQKVSSLLKEKGITAYRLSLDSGVAHSTLAGIMTLRQKSVEFATIIKLAGGFDMTVSEFLNDPLFHEDNLKL